MDRKVALINPRKGWRPALGLLYVAGSLRDAGFDVRVFEFIDENYNVRKNKKIWKEFFKFDPNFIGLGVISWNRKVAGEIIRKIRAETKDKKIICGGKDPSYVPEKYIKFGADVVVIGEGENSIVELLNAFLNKSPLEEVCGIAYKDDNGKVVKTEYREPTDLSNLTRPAFEAVDYKHYSNIRLGGIPGHFIKTGFIMANRGCPYKCKFCAENVRNVYRERPIDDIIDEIKWQIKNYKIKGLVFLDDLFYFREKRVMDFCEAILREQIKLKIYAQIRVDKAKKEILHLMKKAGFIQLAIGVESGSPKILKAVGKGITITQIKDAVKAINDAGIYSYSYLIIGLPYETDEDLKMTEELLKEIKSTFVAVNYYMPMPGTPLYSQEDDELLDGVSYSLTENQTHRSLELQEKMAYYRSKFQSMGQKKPNLNLFRYPGFYFFVVKVLFLHPLVLLKGIILQCHKKIYSSYFEAIRTAMINYKIYGY